MTRTIFARAPCLRAHLRDFLYAIRQLRRFGPGAANEVVAMEFERGQLLAEPVVDEWANEGS